MSIEDRPLERARAFIVEARAFHMDLIQTLEPIENDALILMILNEIPFLNALLKRINSTTSAISKLLKKTGDTPTYILNTTNASPFISIVLNIIDFIQIPLLYLTAFALGKKPPITLSNNGRWLYAGVLLGLCLVAFFIPSTAAFIAIGSAFLGFAASAFTLGKLLYEYYEDKKALKVLMNTIDSGPGAQLLACVSELEAACKAPQINTATIEQLMTKIKRLKQSCGSQKSNIQAQYQEAHILKEKLRIESSFVDGCIGIVLSSLAISGTLVSLFFPPAGFIILLTATLAGTAYVVARLIAAYFMASNNESVIMPLKEQNPSDLLQEQIKQDSTSLLLSTFGLRGVHPSSDSHLKETDAPPTVKKVPSSDMKKQDSEHPRHPSPKH